MTTIRQRRRNRGKRREQSVASQLAMDELIFGNAYFWLCRRGRKHRIDPRTILIYRQDAAEAVPQ